MTARFFRFLVATGVVFVLSLALALLDALEWLVLPQPVRPLIPVVLVLSTLVGIVLLSGSIGIPKKPDAASGESEPTEDETDLTDAATPEVASGARGASGDR